MKIEVEVYNGYNGRSEDKYYCQPVNAAILKQLTDKVGEAAKALGANLVCGGTIDSQVDPNDDWRKYSNHLNTCTVYFYGPAYYYV